MTRYVFHRQDLETYIPPAHTGVVNVRLVAGEQVGDRFESL